MSELMGTDLADQKWLDARVSVLGNGIEAAHDIWTNWYDGRKVGRLHPGQAPGEYIAGRGLRLTLMEALTAMPDASTRQIAEVSGVSKDTVHRARKNVSDETVSEVRDSRTGKLRPGRKPVVIEYVEGSEPPEVVDHDIRAELEAVKAALKALIGAKNDIEHVLLYGEQADHKALRKLAQRAIKTASALDRDIIYAERNVA